MKEKIKWSEPHETQEKIILKFCLLSSVLGNIDQSKKVMNNFCSVFEILFSQIWQVYQIKEIYFYFFYINVTSLIIQRKT